MTTDPALLGQTLRSMRESASLSPDDIARRLQLDPDTLLGYESGELELPARTLLACLEAMGRSLVDLHLSLHPEEAPSPRVEAFLTELRELRPNA